MSETTSIVLVVHTSVNLLSLGFSVKDNKPLSALFSPYACAVICTRGVLLCERAMHCNLVGYNRDLSFRECYFGIRERVVTEIGLLHIRHFLIHGLESLDRKSV